MELTLAEISAYLAKGICPFFRVAGLFMTMPVFSATAIPVRIRVSLAVLITIVIVPLIPTPPAFNIFSFAGVLLIAEQIIIGLAMGFVMKLVFEAFIVAGQLVARQSGLGFAMLVDPQSGMSFPLVSQLYLMLLSLTFLSLNGHHILLEMVTSSFQTLPIGGPGIQGKILWDIALWAKWVFAGAAVIALPSVLALLLVYISFGIMTRASPQLNIFSIGFAITLLVGTVIMFITLPNLIPHIDRLLNDGFTVVHSMIGGR